MLELLVRIEQSLERFSVEKILGRLHLLAWLAVLVGSAVTGWFTYYDRLPSLLVAILAGIGALTILTLATIAVGKLMKVYPRAFGLVVPFSRATKTLYGLTTRSIYTAAQSGKSSSEQLEHMGNRMLAVRDVPIRIYAKKDPSPFADWLTEEEIKRVHWKHGSDNLISTPSGLGVNYTDAMVHRLDLYRHALQMLRG